MTTFETLRFNMEILELPSELTLDQAETIETEMRLILAGKKRKKDRRRAFEKLGYHVAFLGAGKTDLFLDTAKKVLIQTDERTANMVFDCFEKGVREYLSDLDKIQRVMKEMLEKYSLNPHTKIS